MTCGKPVEKGFIAYPCVEDKKGHSGPCWSPDVARSERERRVWETARRPSEDVTKPLPVIQRDSTPGDLPPLTDRELLEIIATDVKSILKGQPVASVVLYQADPLLWIAYREALTSACNIRRWLLQERHE